MLDGHEWQAQRIVGERQISSGLEYEVRVEKTVWLPKATLHTKLGCGGTGQSSGQRLEFVRGGRHGCRAHIAVPVVSSDFDGKQKFVTPRGSVITGFNSYSITCPID